MGRCDCWWFVEECSMVVMDRAADGGSWAGLQVDELAAFVLHVDG